MNLKFKDKFRLLIQTELSECVYIALFKAKELKEIIYEEDIDKDEKSQRRNPGGMTVISGLIEGDKEIGDAEGFCGH